MPISTTPAGSTITIGTTGAAAAVNTPAAAVYAPGATNGVSMTPPPAELLPSLTAAVTRACTAIPAGKSAALVAIAERTAAGEVRANAAVVQKIGDQVTVMGWLGKTWGKGVEAGASVLVSW